MFNVLDNNDLMNLNGGGRLYPVYKIVYKDGHYEKVLIGTSPYPQPIVTLPGNPIM